MKSRWIILVIILLPFLSLADALLYPTTNILPPFAFSVEAGNIGVKAAIGVGGKVEIGYALSYQDLGAYVRYSPIPRTIVGISYLPFNLCLFGTCESASLLNIYGVYALPIEDPSIEVGLKLTDVGFKHDHLGVFCVLEKKVDSSLSFTFENGMIADSTGNFFNVALGFTKHFWLLTFKGGCVWQNVEKISDITSPRWCLEIETMFDFGK